MGGFKEPVQFEFVAQGGDDLGREVGRGRRVVVLGERVEVGGAVAEAGLGGEQRRVERAVVQRHAADVEQVARGLDVAVGEDLAAVRRDDGDGRRTRPGGVRRRWGLVAGDRPERAGREPEGAVAERLPAVRARREVGAGPREPRLVPRVLLDAVARESVQLAREAGKVDHRRGVGVPLKLDSGEGRSGFGV